MHQDELGWHGHVQDGRMKLNVSIVALLATTLFVAAATASTKIPRDYDGHKAYSVGKKMEDTTVCKTIYYDNDNIIAMAGAEGKVETVRASWYGNQFHARQMANGDYFHECDATVIAHKTLPKGTVVRITNISTGLTLLTVVQDRGPYVPSDPRRTIDMSRGAAQHLGLIGSGKGVMELKIEVLGKP